MWTDCRDLTANICWSKQDKGACLVSLGGVRSNRCVLRINCKEINDLMLFDLSMNPWRLSEEYPEEAQAETVYCTYTTAPAAQCETDTASRGRSRTGRSERSREEQRGAERSREEQILSVSCLHLIYLIRLKYNKSKCICFGQVDMSQADTQRE